MLFLTTLIFAARAAHGLAQVEILIDGQLLVAGDEHVVGFSSALRNSSKSFFLSSFFFMETPVVWPVSAG
jgi:hypothetical protein